jgi:hypothetical protein
MNEIINTYDEIKNSNPIIKYLLTTQIFTYMGMSLPTAAIMYFTGSLFLQGKLGKFNEQVILKNIQSTQTDKSYTNQSTQTMDKSYTNQSTQTMDKNYTNQSTMDKNYTNQSTMDKDYQEIGVEIPDNTWSYFNFLYSNEEKITKKE